MNEKKTKQISFLVPAKNASDFLAKSLKEIHFFLESNFKNSYEIILIINGESNDELQAMQAIADQFSRNCSDFKITYSKTKGKGAALKEGFLISCGKNIFFTDADLPFDLTFFIEAFALLQAGQDFICGNRRFENSLFTLPVSVLPMAYKRHRIGLIFNKVTRILFNIKSHDTQAGIKAFSQKLGKLVYSRATCPGFLSDIEFFLVAGQNGFKKTELPVHFFLNSEKSTIHLIKETIETAYWLFKIYYQNWKKHYRFESQMNFKDHYFITADDWGLSPSVNSGILKLAKMGLVRRVSILADGLYIAEHLEELKSIDGIKLGIHFNLTFKNNFN